MSHQSGIQPHADLLAFLAKAKRPSSSSVRLLQIIIQSESIVLKHHINSSHNHRAWSDEYDDLVLPLLDSQSPSYIFYRTDTQDADGSFKWLFILWSPDTASVRDKMLYASTKATLKRAFGEGHIESELFGTVRNDVNLKAYKQARRMSADGDLSPLTHAEREMRNMKFEEAERASGGGRGNSHHYSHIHVSQHHISSKKTSTGDVTVNHQHVQNATSSPPHAVMPRVATAAAAGVAFPIAEDALHAINDFVHRKLTYIQLSIDLLNERILLESSRENLLCSQLISVVPRDKARYHLYRYSHVHTDGQRYEPVFFIYTVPSDFSACPAKERMIYSSCKGPFLEQLQYNVHVHINKKLEISSEDLQSELSEANLKQETHATAARATHADDAGRSQAKFDKPTGPTGSRGPRRLVR